ncbi:uncharacterized protein LOC128392448, partial [Panonychus citri]|uniref:uncharacterized protein LOC128392448 n=1 Tax=Panonychus citri TaxID=50023 RepID=UPI0023070D60
LENTWNNFQHNSYFFLCFFFCLVEKPKSRSSTIQYVGTYPIVILKDVRFVDLKATIDFVYKGEVNVTQNQLGSVLKAAETLQIKGLTDVVNRQRELNAKEMASVDRPKKRKRKQKNNKTSEPSPPVSCDESCGENETLNVISVTMEERTVPIKIFPVQGPSRESEAVERNGREGREEEEMNVIQVAQTDSPPVSSQTILPTTEVTAIEQNDIIVASDATT